jgi:TolA-binding protein
MKTPPRSPELEALLAPHRTVLPLAPSVEARVVARAAAATESSEQSTGRAFGPPLWVFAAAAGLVIALGAAAYAARGWISAPSSPAPAGRAPVTSPRASNPGAPAVVAATPEIDATAAIPPRAAPATRRVAAKTAVATVRPTNAELQLLRAARQDVTRGDFAGALASIGEHVRRFRHGGLVEEREALRVKSLAGLGRHDEAQRAAARFHARFPHSVFLPTFERMKEADR